MKIGSDQSQRTGDNSTAIQAKGDVHVGISLSEVMTVVAQSIQIHTASAQVLVDSRLNEFEQRLTEKFSNGDTSATESFADPDMQGSLFEAQKSYIRSDAESLHEVLADLVYRRAQERGRTRISLVIDDAIEKTSRLTSTDFATLSFIFYIMNVGVTGTSKLDIIGSRFRDHLDQIIESMNLSEGSLDYLDSQGLFLVSHRDKNLTPKPLVSVIVNKFPETFTTGFTQEEILELGGQPEILDNLGLIRDSVFDPQKICLNLNKAGYENLCNKVSILTKDFGARYYDACRGRLADNQQALQVFTRYFPKFPELCQRYDASRTGAVTLGPAAMAIAHGYLVGETSFSGSLSTWIAD